MRRHPNMTDEEERDYWLWKSYRAARRANKFQRKIEATRKAQEALKELEAVREEIAAHEADNGSGNLQPQQNDGGDIPRGEGS